MWAGELQVITTQLPRPPLGLDKPRNPDHVTMVLLAGRCALGATSRRRPGCGSASRPPRRRHRLRAPGTSADGQRRDSGPPPDWLAGGRREACSKAGRRTGRRLADFVAMFIAAYVTSRRRRGAPHPPWTRLSYTADWLPRIPQCLYVYKTDPPTTARPRLIQAKRAATPSKCGCSLMTG